MLPRFLRNSLRCLIFGFWIGFCAKVVGAAKLRGTSLLLWKKPREEEEADVPLNTTSRSVGNGLSAGFDEPNTSVSKNRSETFANDPYKQVEHQGSEQFFVSHFAILFVFDASHASQTLFFLSLLRSFVCEL